MEADTLEVEGIQSNHLLYEFTARNGQVQGSEHAVDDVVVKALSTFEKAKLTIGESTHLILEKLREGPLLGSRFPTCKAANLRLFLFLYHNCIVLVTDYGLLPLHTTLVIFQSQRLFLVATCLGRGSLGSSNTSSRAIFVRRPLPKKGR